MPHCSFVSLRLRSIVLQTNVRRLHQAIIIDCIHTVSPFQSLAFDKSYAQHSRFIWPCKHVVVQLIIITDADMSWIKASLSISLANLPPVTLTPRLNMIHTPYDPNAKIEQAELRRRAKSSSVFHSARSQPPLNAQPTHKDAHAHHVAVHALHPEAKALSLGSTVWLPQLPVAQPVPLDERTGTMSHPHRPVTLIGEDLPPPHAQQPAMPAIDSETISDSSALWRLMRTAASGTASGITKALVGNPFDTIKIRQQTQGVGGKFAGPIDCLMQSCTQRRTTGAV